MFECSALALIAVQACGVASDGQHAILAIQPTSSHQCIPAYSIHRFSTCGTTILGEKNIPRDRLLCIKCIDGDWYSLIGKMLEHVCQFECFFTTCLNKIPNFLHLDEVRVEWLGGLRDVTVLRRTWGFTIFRGTLLGSLLEGDPTVRGSKLRVLYYHEPPLLASCQKQIHFSWPEALNIESHGAGRFKNQNILQVPQKEKGS